MKKILMIIFLALTLNACADMGSGSSTVDDGNGVINNPSPNPRAISDN